MTLRLEMLRAASLAPRLLPDARERIVGFLLQNLNDDGGFRGRSDEAGEAPSDLYYTVFGLDALEALGIQPPLDALEHYLLPFGGGEGLDFVHLACLARCWSHLPPENLEEEVRCEILAAIEACRASDGGYGAAQGAERGTAYGAFLALGACEDLGAELPDAEGLIRSVGALRAADGGYANEPGKAAGLTAPTAAAVTLLRHLSQPVEPAVGDWLLARSGGRGGFLAAAAAPMPDLLSTATALHALAAMGVPLGGHLREAALDFVDSLWSPEGGFRGHWADDALDTEYAFYGLLALGHLSI